VVKWEQLVPWLQKHELRVFLIPLFFLILVGLMSCT
jgi:hypothetical protein